MYVFLPPFASAVQTVFETSPTWQPFWRWYHLELPARLRAAGLPCVPLAVPQHDGFDDRYMYGAGITPTEIYAAALVRRILDHAAPHICYAPWIVRRWTDSSPVRRQRPSPLSPRRHCSAAITQATRRSSGWHGGQPRVRVPSHWALASAGGESTPGKATGETS